MVDMDLSVTRDIDANFPTVIFGDGTTGELIDTFKIEPDSKGRKRVGFIIRPDDNLIHVNHVADDEIEQDGTVSCIVLIDNIKLGDMNPSYPVWFVATDFLGNPATLYEWNLDILNALEEEQNKNKNLLRIIARLERDLEDLSSRDETQKEKEDSMADKVAGKVARLVVGMEKMK